MQTIIGGKPKTVSKLAHAFRTQLMMEHFGLPYYAIVDPLACREEICKIAENNSKLYFDIFKCEPDNSIRSFEKLKNVSEKREKEQQ
jgi:hypothetical protein